MRLRILIIFLLCITNFRCSSALDLLTENEITTTDIYEDSTTNMWPITIKDSFNTDTTTITKVTPTTTTPKITSMLTIPTRPSILNILTTTKKPGSIKSQTIDPVVKISEGELKGSFKKSHYSFIGIRYGQSPEGERRFKPALPETPWEGTRLAQKYGENCPQIPILTNVYTGSEDCLFLNVYTKILPSDSNFTSPLPVMVWLHGGAFKTGSGNFPVTGPEYIIEENVILVTINYRLGALGFLCVNKDAPGNAGIQDQILALKWVKRNIGAFGGDPEQVTIFGFSAGAVSVDILMLSPAAEGLFRSAISQSGSVLNPWSFVRNPKEQAFHLGRDMGFKEQTDDELVAFLKNTTSRNLIEKSIKMEPPAEDRNSMSVSFSPCIEGIYTENTEQPILLTDPQIILRRGTYKKIPYIGGFSADEAILMFKNPILNNKIYNLFRNSDLYYIPSNLNLENVDKPEIQLLAEDIGHVYMGMNKNKSKIKTSDNLVKYGTDIFFMHGITRALRLHAQNGHEQVYAYRFSFDGAMNFYKRFIGYYGAGTAHGDELGYLFTAPPFLYIGVNMKADSKEMIVKNHLVKMWTNFAKYGNPTPNATLENDIKWMPIPSAKNYSYLDINENLVMKDEMPNKERMEFWDMLYAEYEHYDEFKAL